ncbi:MAG: hypothetical protein FWD89_03240 [Firmicutes bacterium]|nr:hypothetical protein [Bacillota bacterium]MCL2771305.1 hypothetical protein [Bacillota bacterium]
MEREKDEKFWEEALRMGYTQETIDSVRSRLSNITDEDIRKYLTKKSDELANHPDIISVREELNLELKNMSPEEREKWSEKVIQEAARKMGIDQTVTDEKKRIKKTFHPDRPPTIEPL